MSTENKNELFGGFDWEDDDTVDFFGGVPGETEPPKSKVEKKEDEEGVPNPPKPKEESEEEEDYFELSKPNTEDTLEQNGQGGSDSGNQYLELYNRYKELGIIKHVELEDGEELDEERLFEIQEEEKELEISERLRLWATEELDEDAQAFLKFKRQGGNTADFFKTYQTNLELPEGDIEDEAYQDRLIRYNLSQEGWDKDEIEDRLQYLTDTNRKEKVAKKYNEKVLEETTKERQSVLKRVEDQKRQAKEQEDNFKSGIKDFLDTTEEVQGFKINPQDKPKLLNFLTKKDHKISDTKSITGFQKKLAEVFQDTDKMVLLAKLISTDFDMSEFEKKVTTKNTRNIKTNLEQRKTLRPSNSGSSLKGSSLAELFN